MQKSQPEVAKYVSKTPAEPMPQVPESMSFKASRGLRERRWPRIDLGELGSRGAVEPAGRIDDASPYRGGDAGATDEEPTAFVDPYAPWLARLLAVERYDLRVS